MATFFKNVAEMSLREIEEKNRDEVKRYVRKYWPNRVMILAFLITLMQDDVEYAIERIESRGEEAFEKWNSGTNYEESLDEANRRLMENINRELNDLIVAGVSVSEAADYLGERFYSTRVHDISRILVTETTRIDAAQELKRGESYTFHCVGDSRTCQECLERDGQVFLSTDADYGSNLPPLHPWCRCWITTNG